MALYLAWRCSFGTWVPHETECSKFSPEVYLNEYLSEGRTRVIAPAVTKLCFQEIINVGVAEPLETSTE